MCDLGEINITDEFGEAHRKHREARKTERNTVMSWSDVEAAATVLPEMQTHARNLIVRILGYLPCAEVTMRFEPAIRAIANNYRMGALRDGDDLVAELEEHIKPIRNMEMTGILSIQYPAEAWHHYHNTWLPYGQAVKDRLTYFLGYEPKPEHSLSIELWLRDVMANDAALLSGKINEIDIKAITSIKYREVLLESGLDAANASPLYGLPLSAAFDPNISDLP